MSICPASSVFFRPPSAFAWGQDARQCAFCRELSGAGVLAEQFQTQPPVIVLHKRIRPPVAAMRDMVRKSYGDDSSESQHGTTLRQAAPQRKIKVCCP